MKPLPLKWKLVGLTMAVVAAALAVAGVALVYDNLATSRDATLDRMRGTTDVIAQSASAALAFGDATAADQLLASLVADPRLLGAAIYDAQGVRFARWARPGALLPELSSAVEDDHEFQHNALIVRRPITVAGDHLGTLVVATDLERLNHVVDRQIIVSVAVLGAVLVVSIGLAY